MDNNKTNKKTIDIIVPCYNEEQNIQAFFKEVQAVVRSIDNYDFKYFFIDDGSGDDTLKEIKTLAKEHDFVHYISFSRNFGKEAAMYAGLNAVKDDGADY